MLTLTLSPWGGGSLNYPNMFVTEKCGLLLYIEGYPEKDVWMQSDWGATNNIKMNNSVSFRLQLASGIFFSSPSHLNTFRSTLSDTATNSGNAVVNKTYGADSQIHFKRTHFRKIKTSYSFPYHVNNSRRKEGKEGGIEGRKAKPKSPEKVTCTRRIIL